MFTLGLTDAVKRLTSEGKSPTPKELRDDADAYIRSKVDKNQVHTPQIMGNETLADAPIKVIALNASNGPNRRKRLLELVALQPQHMDITASSSRYAVDEPVKLTLKIPADGYLNVVSVDSKDNATVLFPNGIQKTNMVSAGAFTFPTSQMAFDLLASEPTGPTLVVAFLSSDPIDFYQDTVEAIFAMRLATSRWISHRCRTPRPAPSASRRARRTSMRRSSSCRSWRRRPASLAPARRQPICGRRPGPESRQVDAGHAGQHTAVVDRGTQAGLHRHHAAPDRQRIGLLVIHRRSAANLCGHFLQRQRQHARLSQLELAGHARLFPSVPAPRDW